jgi:hypothetical protein
VRGHVATLLVWVGLLSAAACTTEPVNVSGGAPGQPCAEPGRTESCYSGPGGTNNIGQCRGGITTCTWDLIWSACEGEQLPAEDICTNTTDDDCDGTVDEGRDDDGDGWGMCEGDCCDNTGCAADPKRVNPGAFEAADNLLDDDCDGMADNPDAGCVAGDLSDPFAYARALDICRTTSEDAIGLDQRWGVISATLTRANGTPLPTTIQAAIKTEFGANTPRYGDTLVVLATGPAADKDDPDWQPWQSGTDVQTGDDGSVPSSWLSANGGVMPSAPGCPKAGGSAVNDPVMLTLKIRVPTNASSFTLSSNFMSAEYPEYVCSSFNDFFIMLLGSAWAGTPANPKDGNLAIYSASNGDQFPVGVNLAQGTGLFRQCVNGPMGCEGSNTSTATSCVSQADLAGTGFDEAALSCGQNGIVGGGTGWLNTTGNVVAGEVITLRIAIWDTGDGIYDSAALIDNFQWKIEPTVPGTGAGQ